MIRQRRALSGSTCAAVMAHTPCSACPSFRPQLQAAAAKDYVADTATGAKDTVTGAAAGTRDYVLNTATGAADTVRETAAEAAERATATKDAAAGRVGEAKEWLLDTVRRMVSWRRARLPWLLLCPPASSGKAR